MTEHPKKVDTSKLSEEEQDFPEFHKKWLDIVVPAQIPKAEKCSSSYWGKYCCQSF